jgi:hypothetical protein
MITAQVSGLTRLGDTILTIGLPLWVIGHTSAPRELAAWLLILNTVIVMLFQVRVVKGADTLPAAAHMQWRALTVLAIACVVLGSSSGLSSWAATVILAIGVIMLTLGEMWGEGAWWAVRYGITPADAQGSYGGAFNLGLAVPAVGGPVMVTGLTSDLRLAGWLILAAIFVGALSVNRRVIAWTERTAARRHPSAWSHGPHCTAQGHDTKAVKPSPDIERGLSC